MWAGVNDLWAYYVFIVLVFSLNALGMYLLARELNISEFASMMAGVFAGLNNYILGNIDNPNVIFYFFGCLALWGLIRFFKNKQSKTFYMAAFYLSMQLLFAPVSFVLFAVSFTALCIYRWHFIFAHLRYNKKVIFCLIPTIVVPLIYSYFYLIKSSIRSNFNYLQDLNMANFFSLSLNDFLRVQPNNPLISFADIYNMIYCSGISTAYLGIGIWSLSALAVYFKPDRFNKFLCVLGAFFFLFSMGPYISLNHIRIVDSPINFLFSDLQIHRLFRMPGRGFIIPVICLSLLAAKGLHVLVRRKSPFKLTVALAASICFFAENYIFALPVYPEYKLVDSHKQYIDMLKTCPETASVLHLPSGIYSKTGQIRELFYMYWQSKYKRNTLNGVLAYYPKERIKTDSLCSALSSSDDLNHLIKSYRLHTVVYHKWLCTSKKDSALTEVISSSLSLTKVYETKDIITLRVKHLQ